MLLLTQWVLLLIYALKIFGVESGLAVRMRILYSSDTSDLNYIHGKLQDHMAMAGTCKQIRRAYTEDAWRVCPIFVI
jgi:hypothetical protein